MAVETPEGNVRARAALNESLEPGVACGQHGWWQACPEIGAPGYDPFGPEGSNLNLLISNAAIDPRPGERIGPASRVSLPDSPPLMRIVRALAGVLGLVTEVSKPLIRSPRLRLRLAKPPAPRRGSRGRRSGSGGRAPQSRHSR